MVLPARRHVDDNHDHRHENAADNDYHGHRGAGHVHAPASFGTAFAIGVTRNTALVATEAVYGFLGNSIEMIDDTGLRAFT